jgi:hypothetical protein
MLVFRKFVVLVCLLELGLAVAVKKEHDGTQHADDLRFLKGKKSSKSKKKDATVCVDTGLEIAVTHADPASDVDEGIEGTLLYLVSAAKVREAWNAAKSVSSPIRATRPEENDTVGTFLMVTSSMSRTTITEASMEAEVYSGLYVDGEADIKYAIVCPLPDATTAGDKCKVYRLTDEDTRDARRLRDCNLTCEGICSSDSDCCESGIKCQGFLTKTCGGCTCFSPLSKVVVEGKGEATLTELAVGDRVLTRTSASGPLDTALAYQTVYDFGDWSRTKATTFLQIYTSSKGAPLEITPDHLIFLQDKEFPVAAAEVKVGDLLVGPEHFSPKVLQIKTVVREGFYAPFTSGSTILVDGILASCYTSQSKEQKSHLTIGGRNLLSWHMISHMWLAPKRLLCLGVSIKLCQPPSAQDVESYYEGWTEAGDSVAQFYEQQNVFVQTLMFLFFIVIFTLPIFFVEQLLLGSLPGAVTLVGLFLLSFYSKTVSKKKAPKKSL